MKKLILILSLCCATQVYSVGDIDLSIIETCIVQVQNMTYSQESKNEALVVALFKGNYAQAKFWLQNGVDLKTACKNRMYFAGEWGEIYKLIPRLYMDTQIDSDGMVILKLSSRFGAKFHNLKQLEYIVKKYSQVKNIEYQDIDNVRNFAASRVQKDL